MMRAFPGADRQDPPLEHYLCLAGAICGSSLGRLNFKVELARANGCLGGKGLRFIDFMPASQPLWKWLPAYPGADPDSFTASDSE